ncbi:unnamed protein product, partial [marine sediment metagenome]
LRTRDIIIMVILAVALAYFLKPVIDLLEKIPSPFGERGRRILTTIVAMAGTVGLMVVLIMVIIKPLSAEFLNLVELNREWAEQVPDKFEEFQERYEHLISPEALDTINEKLGEWGAAILEWHAEMLKGVVLSGRYLIGLVLIPILAFYFLTDSRSLREGSARLIPAEARDTYHAMLSDMDEVMDNYIRTQLMIALGTGIATALTLYLAGVRVYLTFGIMAGVFNLVLIVGPIVAGIPICGITLLQSGWIAMLVVLGVFLLIQAVGGQVIAPKLLSGGAKLHPVVIIISLLIGAELFGVIGLFIAVPVVAALRVGVLHYRAYVGAEGSPADGND